MKRGRADAPVIGAYMAHHGLVPDLAMVSPTTRTKETWSLVAPCFAKPPSMITDDRIYNATVEKLIGAIREARKARTLLVIGHNPGLHDVEAHKRIKESLPTSGLVVIDLPLDDWSSIRPQSGRLERFVTPRLVGAATE
jgi:phosphohistidine phosphatase